VNFVLVSKQILSQNNGPMGWGPAPGKGSQKKAKTPPLAAFPQRTRNRKRNAFFFRFRVEDLLNPWMVWIAL